MDFLFITNSLNGFPQILHETENINLDKIGTYFQQEGHNYSIVNYNSFIHANYNDIKNKFILYASSQYFEYFNYIEDCILYALHCKANIFPNFDMLRSHENKFYQELIKKKYNIRSPKSWMIGTIEDIHNHQKNLKFPLIFKTHNGFGSKGVFIVNNFLELLNLAKKYLNPIFTRNSNYIKKLLEYKSYNDKYNLYKNKYPFYVGRIILQEFIDNINYDWKILVFGNSCFCLKRYVRSNDFRASGSGDFTFNDTPSNELLNFSIEVINKLNTPWASLDIIECNGSFYLIEYQCLHFGLYTLIRNNKYYTKEGPNWVATDVNNAEPEFFFYKALSIFLKNQKFFV